MPHRIATLLGASILPVYIALSIWIGWREQRRTSAPNFLAANRSLPLWIVVTSMLATNCGALDVIGMSGLAAQYGVQAFHFYWIGAIPGMVFLAAVMLPVYVRSKARSLPEYLEYRFDKRVRLLNAWLLLITVTALAGIGIYAISRVLHAVFAWPLTAGVLLSASAVFVYTQLGGIRATIYNEVLQLAVIVIGLIPLLIYSRGPLSSSGLPPGSRYHLWTALPAVSPHSTLDEFGIIVGLGFVLSFSYWCTDFVQMQRALATRNMAESRMVPLLAGFGKLGFSLLVIVPALGASAASMVGKRTSFDETLPLLMATSYGPVLLGLGATALLASLMSSLGANVTAFSSLWIYEIQPTLFPQIGSHNSTCSGRITLTVSVLLGIASSLVAFQFPSLMEYIQLLFSFFGAPFFAVFLAGVFSHRASATGALWGLSSGVIAAATFHALLVAGIFTLGSRLTASFYVAILAFSISLAVTFLVSRRVDAAPAKLSGLVYEWKFLRAELKESPAWWFLAASLLATCAALNYVWR